MDALKTPKTCSTDPAAAKGPRKWDLSLLRVLACLGIVTLHTVFAADEYFAGSITGGEHMISRMVENNMMWAVPVFVMVTGVLQLDPDKTLSMKKLYGRYILRVLIALAACCILFRIFDMIMDGESFTVTGLLQAFTELITAKCWGHLWYLYLLIGLYILLPFYRMIAACASDRQLLYLAGLYLLFVSIIPTAEGFGFTVGFYISESIIYPLYLFLGYMIYAGRLRLGQGTGQILLILSTLAILAMDYVKYGMQIDLPGELFGYASPVIIAQTIGVFTAVCKGWQGPAARSGGKHTEGAGLHLLQAADQCSFGIYLIHMIFIRTLFRYMQWNPYETMPVPALAAVVIGIFLVSFLITWVLRMIPGIRWVV